ncbi:MAG: hypothetical protein GY864_08875 [Desulfobacterales bacterium]|nr:hypothetical protein [Desulfobacterales bacterium]
MAIKGVLKEELEKLPAGSLIKKKIKGHEYYYVVMRENGEVKFVYKGKEVPEALVEEYARTKELRAKYRKLLSQVKKQIKFLKGTLRGQESI